MRTAGRYALQSLGLVTLGLVAYAVAINVDTPSYWLTAGVVIGIPLLFYAAFSSRVEVSLVLLLLYVGMIDGFIRLKTGQRSLTLLRDLLLYAVVMGWLARLVLARAPVSIPPLTGALLAYVTIVVVQIANPNSLSLRHSVEALRPELEWTPLFFIGYAIVRTKARLRMFLLLLVIVAAANAIVGYVQFSLTPEQLSSWGPGYRDLVEGTGDVSGRVFRSDGGEVLVRPMGLGADTGFGGAVALLAVAPAIALASRARWRTSGKIALFLVWGPVVGVITSQGRTALLASLAALLLYVAFTAAARRLVPSLAAVLFAGVVAALVVSAISSGANSGSFDRYKTVKPSELLGSVESSRGFSIGRIPELAGEVPLGGGLGGVGPGSSAAGPAPNGQLNGETQITFLISEVGLVGLVILCGLHLFVVVAAAVRVRRIADPELRTLLAAVAASLAAMCATWLSGPSTASTPGAPFFWFSIGLFAWWLFDPRSRAVEGALSRGPARTERPGSEYTLGAAVPS